MNVRAVAVDYANTLPLRSGLKSMEATGQLSMALARPARATELFRKGDYDLGLLPAAAHLTNPETQFVGNYGIVADGFVGSVGVFSEVPLEEIKQLYLDHDSRSSVLLAQVLMKHHWKLSDTTSSQVEFLKAPEGYRQMIGGTTAGVIIGDPAIEARSVFPYYYDLGEAWKEMTGLPFVFAAWLSSTPLSPVFVEAFDAAQAEGVSNRVALAKKYQPFVPDYDLKAYFTSQIKYRITDEAKEGLGRFLQLGADILGMPHTNKNPVFS